MLAHETEFLTARETAKLIRSTPGGLAAARCKRSPNSPPYLKTGKRVLYKRSDVLFWMSQHVVDPTKGRRNHEET